MLIVLGLLVAASSASAAVPYARGLDMPKPQELGPLQKSERADILPTPPDNPEVGDSWIWHLFYHFPMPPHFSEISCTVRGKSDHAYVVVEDSQWGINMTQADVDQILERWENSSPAHPDQGVYALNTSLFGTPPDALDNDERIYLLYYDFGIASDGFFFSWDEEPDGTYAYPSNECEVLYLNCNASDTAGSDYMMSVAAHEFTHMIHWAQDPDEDIWVDEGLAELAMWNFGHPDPITQFNEDPDLSLVDWAGMGEPSYPHYVKVYLWTLYFYERFGGSDAVHAIITEQDNSIAGYEDALATLGTGTTVTDLFADWAVANVLDDPGLADGRYGYTGADLPAFTRATTVDMYPFAGIDETVNPWATDFLGFEGFAAGDALRLEFNGDSAADFAVTCIIETPGQTAGVGRMALDNESDGAVTVAGLTSTSQVTLVVARVSEAGSGSYTVEGSNNVVGVSDAPTPSARLMPCHPNPFNPSTTIVFSLEQSQRATVSVHDLAGRTVKTLTDAVQPAGRHSVTWDGTDDTGRPLASGTYLCRLRAGGQSQTRSMVLVK